MKKVAFSVNNARRQSDKRLSGFGYLSEGNLLCPCISKNNKPFIRVFDDVEQHCHPIKDKPDEFKGYEAYIFCAAINNEFDKTHPNELKAYIFLVSECYLKDSNHTPLGELSDFMAENWDKIKYLSRFDILEKFYKQLD